MKKVKYNGPIPVIAPTLGLEIKPGDTLDVPDDFVNGAFEEVPAAPPAKDEAKDSKKG